MRLGERKEGPGPETGLSERNRGPSRRVCTSERAIVPEFTDAIRHSRAMVNSSHCSSTRGAGRPVARAALLAGALLLLGSAPAVAASGSTAPAPAATPAASGEPAWTENPGLILRLHHPQAPETETPAVPADDEYGEVFDSSDYQAMLLLPARSACAYVLEISSLKARAYARDLVVDAEGGLHVPAPENSTEAGTARADADGRLRLRHDGVEIFVEPAPPLIGFLTREELEARLPVYARRTIVYRPDPKMVALLRNEREKIEILAFFGSWCSDCKELLPALFATLDAAANPAFQVSCIGVDEDMKEPAELLSSYQVGATPTFLVLSDGIELGRISGEATRTVEADLVAILTQGSGGR